MKTVPAATRARDDRAWAFVLILPSLLGIAVFNLLPTLASLGLSLTQWNLLGTPRWVGLANYQELLADPLFSQVMVQTLWFVGASVLIEIGLALAIAVALNRRIRLLALWRTAYFLPVVTSMVAGAILWGWVYDPHHGPLNALIKGLGHPGINWLSDPAWALWAIVFLSVWKNLGYTMILLLAGLQAIPESLLEAARTDGANVWQTFRRVTLPMLSPSLFLVSILSLIHAFQAFDSVYLLTQGGPNDQTNVLVYWLYQNAFLYYNIGRASALAYILFVIILGLTLLQWWLRKRWVVYE